MSDQEKAAVDTASGSGPADADISTERRSPGADAPSHPSISEQSWRCIESGRKQSLEELIQQARRNSRFHAGSSSRVRLFVLSAGACE